MRNPVGVVLVYITLAIALIIGIGAIAMTYGNVVYLPACKHEDGNPDGTPCIWTHPRTGVKYVVDSSEYLD